jgi:hypothetical protein
MTGKKITFDEASSSAIIVKNAILARSGIYLYSYDEMLRRGHTPEVKKEFYREYRPASVLVAARDKFKYAILTKEHPMSITSDNIQQVIEGVVGGAIEVVTLDNNEIALKGEIAFYTKDAVAYYDTGAKETSAQYISKVSPVFGDDYDYILEEIQEVQGLALTRQGRGGASVAVLDSLISADQQSADKIKQGDKVMSSKNSILSFLGIGKAPQDELSSLVMDSLNGYSGLSDSEKTARKAKVDLLINPLADSPEKKILVDTVKDCFSYPKEVLEKSEEVSKGIKSLYKLCVSSDAAALQTTFDAIKAESKDEDYESKKKEEDETKDAEAKKKEEEEKETKDAEDKKKKEEEDKKKKESEGTKDSVGFTAADLEAIVTRVSDSMSVKIDEAVKKHLGIEVKTGNETKDSILPSFSSEEKDNSFLLNGMFQ